MSISPSESYAPTGELINIPNEDHFGAVDKACRGLIELPAAEHHGLLFVRPDKDGKLDPVELLGAELSNEFSTYQAHRLCNAGETTIAKATQWKLANGLPLARPITLADFIKTH